MLVLAVTQSECLRVHTLNMLCTLELIQQVSTAVWPLKSRPSRISAVTLLAVSFLTRVNQRSVECITGGGTQTVIHCFGGGSTLSHFLSSVSPRKSEKERERVQKEGGEGGGREKDGDKGKLSKKRRKSSSGTYVHGINNSQKYTRMVDVYCI